MSAGLPALTVAELGELVIKASRAKANARLAGHDLIGAHLAVGWRMHERFKALARKQIEESMPDCYPVDAAPAFLTPGGSVGTLTGLPIKFDPTLHGDATVLRWEVLL